MNARLHASVWDALVDDPVAAADLTARSILLIGARERVRSWALSDDQAADRLGVTVDVLCDLHTATLPRFSRAALLDLARRAGCDEG